MIVTPDRMACSQYKTELDKYYPTEASKVVISTTANDEFEFKQKFALTKDQQETIMDKFNDPDSNIKFLIVTAKLLTGFDAPILQTMYLDKSLKDHTLLQAICRTNRPYVGKNYGCIVDYFGVFDDIANSLNFDDEHVKTIISNISELRDQLPILMEKTLLHFEGVDRKIEGFEGLQIAQDKINTDEKKDAFAKDFKFLNRVWESLSPDKLLNLYQNDYRWLAQVYESVRPDSDNTGKLLWLAFGAQTTKLIHDNIHSGKVHNLDEFILDEEVIENLFEKPNSKEAEKIKKILIRRLKKFPNEPSFKSISERLSDLQNRVEEGLVNSIQFIKELCELAKEILQVEKELQEKTPQAALTELFLEIKTDQTPAVVERIVTDIDAIVRVVRFPNWQNSNSGQREVQKSLRKTLLKYKLHKDQILFDRAYQYIREYY